MGGCLSGGNEDEQVENEIDEEMVQYKQTEEIKYKLLLLGAGESGKSTLLKQMRSIHGEPFSDVELLAAKVHLTQNVIEAMRTLAIYSDLFADQGKDTKVSNENQSIRDRVARMSDKQKLTEQHCTDFDTLWKDKGIQQTLEYRAQYQIIDTAEYLFENMKHYWRDDYIPTFEDLIHCRQRTTGVNKIQFAIKDKEENMQEIYEIFDVGGQKNERRKWVHFFDNTAAIIFVAALSGYNQLLWEDNRNNRMREAIGLFRGIVNLPAFKESHIILFLNKSDLFKIKIPKFPIKHFFKDYKGDNSEQDAIKFFEKKFCEQRRGDAIGKDIYAHVTCATDGNCVKKMFNSVRDIVIQKELREGGFL